MTLAEELAELAGKVRGLKSELERLSVRIVNEPRKVERSELRREQGALAGECLSLRLAMLYKIEDNWPAVLNALRATPAVTGNKGKS